MRHEMMIPQDGKAYGVVTGLRRGFNGKPPRSNTVALTDTLCTRADGTQYVIARNTRKSGTTRKSRTTVSTGLTRDYILAARMAHQ